MDQNIQQGKNYEKNKKKKEKKKAKKEQQQSELKVIEDSIEDKDQSEEVIWGIKQLKLGLMNKLTPEQEQESLEVLSLLESSDTPIVKKMQLMRSIFGDYRKLMKVYK